MRIAALALFGLMATVPARAEQLTVVELFTSQGCNSCPPADALLQELTKRADLLPLSLHVDYWDYLGWKDSFSSAWATARQRGYARTFNSRSVYTPQIVAPGLGHAVGSDRTEVNRLIARAAKEPPLDIGVVRDGTGATITLPVRAKAAGDVFLAEYAPLRNVKIERGENAGETITYVNIVTRIVKVGVWNGSATSLRVDLPAGGELAAAILVQEGEQGRMLGAARVPKAG